MQEFSDPGKDQFVSWLNRQWHLDIRSLRPDIEIQGSPERTLSRGVVETVDGSLFLLEKFPGSKFRHRSTVAKTVDYLYRKGLEQAAGYKRSAGDEFLVPFKGAYYQVSPFLYSTGIKRPDYLASAETGKAFADFLYRMSRASEGIEDKIALDSFSLKNYIYSLFRRMKKHDRKMYDRYLPYLHFLEKEFMGIHDALPVSFSHGDLHPLNVIWNHDRIRAVIDWEFIGMKPDIYDAANLVGCAGIENPEGLLMPMVTGFLKTVHRKRQFSRLGSRYFPEYVLALRFAWLSEWLRKKDDEMLEMEAAFMGIIMENADFLRRSWFEKGLL